MLAPLSEQFGLKSIQVAARDFDSMCFEHTERSVVLLRPKVAEVGNESHVFVIESTGPAPDQVRISDALIITGDCLSTFEYN